MAKGQRWTDSPFLRCKSSRWWFTSTQFIFLGVQENRFPTPNYITIEVNDSSMILTELWQTGADLTHEIHYISSIHLLDSFAKFWKYIPFAHLPHLFPTCLTNQLQSRQSVVMLLALQTVALIFNEIDKNISFSRVVVFPLPLRRQLK